MKSVTKSLSYFLLLSFFISCQKNIEKQPAQKEIASGVNQNKGHGHLQQTKTFSADVIIRWLNMQLDMLRVPLAPGSTGSQAANRAMAYCGIATYESVVPGMPAYQTLSGQNLARKGKYRGLRLQRISITL